jgi:carbonic anhydrase
MQGVLNRPAVRDLPLVDGWLHHAEASLAAAQARQPGATVDVDDLARANVMVQADRLLGYPFIAEAVDAGELFIHRWLFQIADGQLWRHDQRQGEFVRFEDSGGPIDEASA